jgi:hypothetical protein
MPISVLENDNTRLLPMMLKTPRANGYPQVVHILDLSPAHIMDSDGISVEILVGQC